VAVSAKEGIMKKKPMKTKRYADEGLVEEDFKKKGLDSSKDERVGFFERLRMGNIDNPNSEAYKRFGAGRGRMDAERAANAAAPNQDISRMGKSEVSSPFLMGRVPMGGSSEAPTESRRLPITIEGDYSGKPSEAGVIKPTVRRSSSSSSLPRNRNAPGYQTDEEGPAQIGSQNTFNMDRAFRQQPTSQLTDVSGLGGARSVDKTARSFKGTTRPENATMGGTYNKTGIPATDAEGFKAMKDANKAKLRAVETENQRTFKERAEAAKAEADKAEADKPKAAKVKKESKKVLANKAKSSTSLKAPGSKMDMNDPFSMTLGSDLDPKSMMMKNRRLSGDMDYKKGGKIKARAKPMQKFASGGSVSSASKRGDGIAQKGKTKGRIC